MARPVGQLERGLADITIGLHQARESRAKVAHAAGAAEIEQQILVPLEGSAGSEWNSTDIFVAFEVPFTEAALQRDAPWGHPHFSYGIEFRDPPSGLVVIHPCVVKWEKDTSGNTYGATVRFQAGAPGSTGETPFNAYAHLRFQGWAGDVEEGEHA